MANLDQIVRFCDARVRREQIKDFEGASNGLQVENNGTVSKVGAAVDAGLVPFREAGARGIDFLICHHGLFWNPPLPLTGQNFRKIEHALAHNLAVYGAHLPLDCHPEIGNNACLAEALQLPRTGTFLNYEGNDIATIAKGPPGGRAELVERLKAIFPATYQGIEYGSEVPESVAILTGSGQSAVPQLRKQGLDTLITGELKQHHFNMAQELELNVYPCGHYATEVFGVQALAREVADAFDLEWEFIEQPCPL